MRERGHAPRRQPGAHGQRRQGLQHGRRGVAVGVDDQQGGTRQAHELFGAFGVAAQPEQVFAHATADRPAALHDVVHLQALRQHGEVVHRAFGAHPGVQAAAAALHADTGVFTPRHTRHAARQHVPAALAIGDGINTHHRRARTQCRVAPNRGARKAQAPLHCPGLGVFGNRGRLRLADLRGSPLGRVGAAHQLVIELIAHVGPGRGFATPPGGQAGHQQGLAQEGLGDAGHEALNGGRLQKRAAQRIGHHHRAGTGSLQQAGHAQGRIGPQFQRIAEIIVQPSQHAVHRLQALDRLQVQALTAHGEVPTLHQGQAQVTRQVGVFEVGLGKTPGGEQHDARRVRARDFARGGLQRVEQAAVAAGDVLHAQIAKGIGKLPRDDEPVVQHIAQARRSLRALRHLPPAAIGPARQIKGHDEQAQAQRWRRAGHRPQPARVAQQQRGWQQALMQQPLRPVQIRQQTFQQLGALHDAGFDGGPLTRLHDVRQQFQRPGPAGHTAGCGVAEHVVCDAVELDTLRHLADAAREVARQIGHTACSRQGLGKFFPRGAQGAVVVTQFVPDARLGRQGAAEQQVRGRRVRGRLGLELAPEGQRGLGLRLGL